MLGSTVLTEVTYLPNGKFNLFSVTKMMERGWTLGGSSEKMWIKKGKQEVFFDIKIPTPKGTLFAVYIQHQCETALVTEDIQPGRMKVPIQKAHDLLGHLNESGTRRAAEALGWTITRGTMMPCGLCGVAKAKQKNVPQVSEHV